MNHDESNYMDGVEAGCTSSFEMPGNYNQKMFVIQSSPFYIEEKK